MAPQLYIEKPVMTSVGEKEEPMYVEKEVFSE